MSGTPLSLATSSVGAAPSRWKNDLRRFGEPATIIMAMAVLTLMFLVLYPLFWLMYGSFSYGEQGLAASLAQLWQLPGLERALVNTGWLVCDTVPLSFLFAAL